MCIRDRAANVLVTVEEVACNGRPCARWLFIPPQSLETVMQRVCEMLDIADGWGGYMHASFQHLSVEQQDELIKEFAKSGDVYVVEQHHGEVVLVPAGYMHLVHNFQFSIKVAVELCAASDLPAVVWGRQQKARMCEDWEHPVCVPPPEYLSVGSICDALCGALDK